MRVKRQVVLFENTGWWADCNLSKREAEGISYSYRYAVFIRNNYKSFHNILMIFNFVYIQFPMGK